MAEKNRYFFAIFIGLQILCTFLSSYYTYLSSTELWSLNLAKELFPLSTDHVHIYTRTAFYVLLWPLHQLFSDNVTLILLARGLFWLVSLGGLYAFYKLAMSLNKDRAFALLAVVLFLSVSVVLSRSFRIRSDLLAGALNLFFVYLLVSRNLLDDKLKPGKNWFSLLVLQVLVFLATPKAIYFILANFLGLSAFLFLQRQISWRNLGFVFSITLLPICGLFTIFALLEQLQPQHFLSQAYIAAIEYFVAGFYESAEQIRQVSLNSFNMYQPLILQNPLLIAICFFAGFLFIKNLLKKEIFQKLNKINLISCIAIFNFVFILFHNQKQIFFLVAHLPLVVLTLFYFIWPHLKNKSSAVKIGFCLIALTNSFYFTWQNIGIKNNQQQVEFIEKYQTYLGNNPSLRAVDTIGLLPLKSPIFAYTGPGENNKNHVLEALRKYDPDLYIYVNHSLYLEPEISYWLNEHYHSAGNGIWVKCWPLSLIYEGFIENADGLQLYTYEAQSVKKFGLADMKKVQKELKNNGQELNNKSCLSLYPPLKHQGLHMRHLFAHDLQ